MENYPGATIRMIGFAAYSEFNAWMEQHGKRIRLLHVTNTPTRESWRILATYQELQKLKKVENAKP